MKNKFKENDVVICLRLSPNLGNSGQVGERYRVRAIAPKVRITPGTGAYFAHCENETQTHFASFNLMDIKRI